MSRSHLAVLLLLLGTSLHAQVVVPGNLLPNPGFEETKDGFPVGWSTFEAKARSLVAIDRREVFAGQYALRVTGDPGENWAPLFSAGLKAEPGAEYTLGCYARTQLKPATGSLTFALREISDDGQSIRFDHVPVPHQSDWGFFSQTFKLSAKATALQVFIVLQKCEGTIWLDDLVLVKGSLPDPEALQARQRQPSAAAIAPEVPRYTNLLPNSGFETAAGELPASWAFSGTAGQKGQVDQVCRFVGVSAFRQTHAAAGLPASYLHPVAPVSLEPNADYRLAAWVRTEPGCRSAWTSVAVARGQRVEGAGLQLLFRDEKDQVASQVWTRPVQTNGQWQLLEVVGRAPGNATTAEVRLYQGDLRGASWFDAVRLERVNGTDDLQPLWSLPADTYAPGPLPPSYHFRGAGSADLVAGTPPAGLLLRLASPGVLRLPAADASFPGDFRLSGRLRCAAGAGEARLVVRSVGAHEAVLHSRELPLPLGEVWRDFSLDYTPDPLAVRFTAEVVVTGADLAVELAPLTLQRLSRLTIEEYAARSFPPTASTTPTPAGPTQIAFKPRGGMPELLLNGQPVSPTQYWYTDPPRPEVVEAARRAGLVQTVSFADIDWSREPAAIDFASLDAQVHAVLKGAPNAWLMLCPDTTGEMGKISWAKYHPDQVYVDETAATALRAYSGEHKLFPSFASPVWRAAMNHLLTEVIAHVRQADYAPRVIGYQLSGYEWFTWGYSEQHMDYSPHVRDAFRTWLQDRYGTAERLGAAWRKPGLTFATVELPTVGERRQTVDGVFRDPETQAAVIDFSRFHNELIADALIGQARTVKQAAGPSALVSCYYGYAIHFFDSLTRETAGHLGVRKLLESGLFALSGGPTDGYILERGLGGTGGFMTLPGSYPLHGLLYLDQPDFRTHWSGQEIERTTTVAEDLALYQREFALALTNDVPIQYLDWQRGWTMGDPRLVEEIRRYGEVERFAQTLDRRPPAEGMAVLFSEESADVIGTERVLFDGGLLYHQRPLFFRSGLPHRYYLLSDLARPDLPDYRLWVFPNAFRLTAAERDLIRRKCLRNGNVVVFVYAPGLVDEQRLARANMEALLGMKLEKLAGPATASITIEASARCPWLQDSPGITYGQSVWSPLYAVTDPAAQVLGRWTAGGQPGLAMKDFGSYKVVYSGTGLLPPDLLRDLGRLAGANVYCDTNDALYADRNFVGLHARTPGHKRLRLPRRADVYDVLGRKLLARDTDSVELDLEAFETALLYVGEASKAEGFFGR